MNADLLDVLFYCAGFAFAAHLAASFLLKYQLRGDDELTRSLFLLPNTWLGNTHGQRLLRSKYFIPWVEHPEDIDDYSFAVRGTFMLARIAGGAFIVLILAFFASAIWVGGHQ